MSLDGERLRERALRAGVGSGDPRLPQNLALYGRGPS